ncbi:hypothetical protein FNV43_RR19416 [Rhamnella rubrinervis]|uniref:Transmembrane protein n=1 Tax=Rhamnella rubrinervis TaxID=2594499 RepID=A0A8K0DZ62_9ROSA|nr:hypothetical protein FNV43_RR19416 [Rhamnella rubrinervis]
MEHDGLRESDTEVDLESAETDTRSEEDRSTDSDTSERQPKKMMGRMRGGHMRLVNGLTRGSSDGFLGSSMSSGQDLDVQKKTEDRIRKEKQRKTSSKRYPKPPRPPGGPSLDAADMKLVKEISEHVRSRRARREKMKELTKKRADKISSSNINIFAMLITIIFCFVVILQGILGSRVEHSKQTMIHKQKLMGPCSELDFPDQVHTGSEIEFAYTSEDKNVTGMQDRVVNSDSKHVYKVLLAFW